MTADQMLAAKSHPAGLIALARAILSDRNNEITCAECRSWLPTYVEEDHRLAAAWYPLVGQHLALCPSCAAAYAALSEAVDLASSGVLVEPPTYPRFQVPRSRDS